MIRSVLPVLFSVIFFIGCRSSREGTTRTGDKNQPLMSELLANLLASHPDYFDSVINRKDDFGFQVIYTQIDTDAANRPVFTDHYYNVDADKYFYPASTVKLPVALLALQRLNELKQPGLDMHSTMITGADSGSQSEVYNDPTTPDGRPTVAHYVKKILLVSDNDAFNRLYEFLGQEYINRSLRKVGYSRTEIVHRLDIALSEEENRHANPVSFYDVAAKLIYQKPAEKSKWVYAKRNDKMGTGYYSGGELKQGPFDFSKKNRLALTELHQVLKSVIFPSAMEPSQRFNLEADDYALVRKHMSMLPRESTFPSYDSSFHDNYVKFILYGMEQGEQERGIRIFNKTGTAYGFLIDAAYVVDFENRIEFMLSVVIHCNSDGIYNDSKYDYAEVGYPFMKRLGQVLYDHERKREKKYLPDLSEFIFDYKQ